MRAYALIAVLLYASSVPALAQSNSSQASDKAVMKAIDMLTKRGKAQSAQSTQTDQQSHEAPSPHADKVWSDPATGLTWMRCDVGQSANRSRLDGGIVECGGGGYRDPTWDEAILRAKTFEYAGANDWRVPTFEEVKTIFKCDLPIARKNGVLTQPRADMVLIEGNWMCPADSKGPRFRREVGFGTLWTTSLAAEHLGDSSETIKKLQASKARVFIHTIVDSAMATARFPVVYVRGGQPTNEWANAMTDAKGIQDTINTEKQAEQQEQQKRIEAAAVANQKNRDAREVAYKAAVEKCNAEQRRIDTNVKQGDKVRQGLVVGFQGDLVLVQTYEMVCQGLRRQDGSCNSLDYKRVAAGNELFRRSDLKAVCAPPLR